MRSPNKQFYKLGLIGHPVAHSLSPLMHRAAITFCGLQGSYELIDLSADQLAVGVELLKREGYSGFNVTVPHKQAVMPLIDELTAQAQQVQAVNTVRIEASGKMIGHNTDIGGFVRSLGQCLAGKDTTGVACLIGSGGAARAALWGLYQLGFRRLVLVARNEQAAIKMQGAFEAALLPDSDVQISFVAAGSLLTNNLAQDVAVLVNTTSIGVSDMFVPPWYDALITAVAEQKRRPFFYDMVYARGNSATLLQGVAARAGLPTSDGLQMLIGQASLAFQFWTDIEVPATVMSSGLQAEQSTGC